MAGLEFLLNGLAADLFAYWMAPEGAGSHDCKHCERLVNIASGAITPAPNKGVRVRFNSYDEAFSHMAAKLRAFAVRLKADGHHPDHFKGAVQLNKLASELEAWEGLTKKEAMPEMGPWDPNDFIPIWVSVLERTPTSQETDRVGGFFYVVRTIKGRSNIASRFWDRVHSSWLRPVLGTKAAKNPSIDTHVTHWLRFSPPDRVPVRKHPKEG